MYQYQYPHPAVSADCVVFSQKADGNFLVLLIQRAHDPYKGCWAFPGGFMNIDEDAATCARRELLEETGLSVNSVQQIAAYTAVDRDPRERVLTIAYYAVVEQPFDVTAGDDAAQAQWFPINQLPPLAFDHEQILRDALTRIDV